MADDEMGRGSRTKLFSAGHVAPARYADEDTGLVDRWPDSPQSSHSDADPEPAHRYRGCRLRTRRTRHSAWPIRSLLGMGALPRFLRCRVLLPGGQLVWRLLAEHHSCRELGLGQETCCVSDSSNSQAK